MTLARGSLMVVVLAVVALLGLGVLEEIGVGLSDRGPYSEDVYQQIAELSVEHEEWYLAYGRWFDLLTAIAFTALLVAVPFVMHVARAKHVLVTGAAVAALGDVIDLSQLVGIDEARWALATDLPLNFIAGNTFRFSINTTSTYVWVAGMFLLAVGLLILARDAADVTWRTVSILFAGALIATGVTDLWGSSLSFELAQYALAAFALAWVFVAMRRLDERTTRVAVHC